MSQGARGLMSSRVWTLALAGLCLSGPVQAYVVRQDGNPGTANHRDVARAVRIGPDGAIVAAGTLETAPEDCEGTPPAPDQDDKVLDCALQDQIRAEIDRLLATLGG